MVATIKKFFTELGENKNKKKTIGIKVKDLFVKNLLDEKRAIYFPRSPDVGVLLLHSYTSTPYEFYDLASHLAKKDYTVYAPPLAGHGTTPEDLAKTTIEDWQKSVEDAYLFLKGRVKKIFIVGSSFGGNLAFHLATNLDNPIAGVVSMGTPIRIKWERCCKLCLYSYGWFKKNHKKKRHLYEIMYINQEQIVYPVIPASSLRRFFYFVKKITIPNLAKVQAPTLIIQSSSDRVVHPKSAQYLHQHLGSANKRILWVNGTSHALAVDEKRGLIFKAICRFIEEN